MGQQWSKGWAQKKDMKPKWPQTQEQQPDSSGKMLPEAATQPLLSQNWSAGVFPTTHPPPSPPSRTQPPRAHKWPKRCRAEAKPLKPAHVEYYTWGTFQPTPLTCPNCLGQIMSSTLQLLFMHTKYIKLIPWFIFPHILINNKTIFCSLERSFPLSFHTRDLHENASLPKLLIKKSEESNKKSVKITSLF